MNIKIYLLGLLCFIVFIINCEKYKSDCEPFTSSISSMKLEVPTKPTKIDSTIIKTPYTLEHIIGKVGIVLGQPAYLYSRPDTVSAIMGMADYYEMLPSCSNNRRLWYHNDEQLWYKVYWQNKEVWIPARSFLVDYEQLISPDNRYILIRNYYGMGPNGKFYDLWLIERETKKRYLLHKEAHDLFSIVSWSPNGHLVLYEIDGIIYVYNVIVHQTTILVEEGLSPVWSPDGEYIYYRATNPKDKQNFSDSVWRIHLNGGNQEEILSVDTVQYWDYVDDRHFMEPSPITWEIEENDKKYFQAEFRRFTSGRRIIRIKASEEGKILKKEIVGKRSKRAKIITTNTNIDDVPADTLSN